DSAIGRYTLEVIRVPGNGPEDVVFDAEGRMLTGLEDGRILRISQDGQRIETLANTQGRPLGLEFLPDGRLLVCDSRRGLLRIDLERGAVEAWLTDLAGVPMRFCNNAAVARDGTVYFSDSSRRFGIDYWRADLIEHSGTGRLARIAPDGKAEVLIDGLQFANGVALAPDETFVCVAETGGYQVQRYWLRGPRAGQRDLLIGELGGFPDNISTGSDGLIWITQAAPRNKLLDFLHPRWPVLRKLAWALPEALQPQPFRVVWVLGVAPEDGRIVHDISYPGHAYHMVTGVRERAGLLALGSLEEDAIALLRHV
ncbi:MAG TPA: SMP-30/gluconolactonase/LRE family protein, partial [Polyangiales bacterium]